MVTATSRVLAAVLAVFVVLTPAASRVALAQAPSAGGTPTVGTKAPDFTLVSIDGVRVTLSAELARGPVVLIVGRGWVGYQCPFCTRQFGDFLGQAKAIEAAGARVIWVYPGPADQVDQRANEFRADRDFPANFRFVLDPNYTFTNQWGLRWNAPSETAYPSTFVIDRGGFVRFAKISRTHDGRATAAEVLAVLARG